MVSLSLEVASYEWVTMESLARKEARSTYVILKDKKEIHFPSLLHGELMIWGITERIISEIIGEN